MGGGIPRLDVRSARPLAGPVAYLCSIQSELPPSVAVTSHMGKRNDLQYPPQKIAEAVRAAKKSPCPTMLLNL